MTEPDAARTILVVDDDQDIRETFCLVLQAVGYDVVTASDGAEALSRLRSTRSVGLVLLDMMMPGMNGWSFREAQRADHAIDGIPVIVVTGDGHAAEKAEALDAAGYLHKPVELSELLPTVARHLGRIPARS